MTPAAEAGGGAGAGVPNEGDALGALEQARFVALTTYRRTGAPVVTPMGPIAREGKFYLFTPSHSGKVRRLRNNPRVVLAPCTRRGTVTGRAVGGLARVLEGDEAARMDAAFRRKWGLPFRLFSWIERLRGVRRCVIEVVPARAPTTPLER